MNTLETIKVSTQTKQLDVEFDGRVKQLFYELDMEGTSHKEKLK